MERTGFFFEFSSEKFPSLDTDDFFPWRYHFNVLDPWMHRGMFRKWGAKDDTEVLNVHETHLYRWSNIIFLITTSQSYLKSKNNYLNIELFCLLGRERIWKKWRWYSLQPNSSFYESDLNSLLQMGPFGQNHFITIICCWFKNVLCLSIRLDMTSL